MVSPANWTKFCTLAGMSQIVWPLHDCFPHRTLEGRPNIVSRSQMYNSLKLSKRETREQSVSSFVVRIMELHLNWSHPVTCSIEIHIKANFPNPVTDAPKIHRHTNLPVWVIGPIEERRFANTSFHVACVDLEPIREEKSLTGSNTNCRTDKATRGGEWDPIGFCFQILKMNTSIEMKQVLKP